MADKILATVGGIAITEKDIDELIMSLGQRGAAYNNKEGRRIILNQVIGNKLLLLDAKRNLYEAEPAFREQLGRVKENLLINYAGEKVFLSVSNVPDTEVKEYYENNKEKFARGETVNASHILVDSEEKANAILSEIEAGKSFEDSAREYSSCPSKDNGGNLGDFGRGQMVPEFDKAVFSMAVGEITKTPVKTQFGYHLIKLISKSESDTTPFEEIKDDIKEALLAEKRRKAYESKINQLKIMYPVDMNAF